MNEEPSEGLIAAFWAWFAQHAAALTELATNPTTGLLDELDARVQALGVVAWEIGPGRELDWCFVLSPGGDRERLAHTRAIVAAAPEVTSWEFRPAVPAKPDWSLEFSFRGARDREIAVDGTAWRAVLLQYPDDAIELVVETRGLASASEHDRATAALIAVDGLLGEARRLDVLDGVIAATKLTPDEAGGSFPLIELAGRLDER